MIVRDMSTLAATPGPTGMGVRAPLRREGADKLTGATRFTDDLVVPGAWYGLTVRSSEPHARLLGIDLDPSFDWSQVVVVTAADIPGDNVVALIVDDQPALVADEIRHVAEPVALVAAPDPALARAARDAVRLRTTPLPAVLDPLTATASVKTFEIVKGDLDAGFAGADLVLEGTYRTGHQEQLYLETQAMIAIPRDDGGMEIHGSMQCPYYVHTAVMRALGLDRARVVVVQEETGGGFGGKEDYPSLLAIHAALLARKAGRPVRMAYDRHEDIAATTKRHPSVIRHRTGVTRDGRLVAQDIDIVFDAGAYTTVSPVVLSRGGIHAGGPYACPNVRIRARAAITNTPPNGAFRGFGAPQAAFAVETHLDRMADALGISPLEIRSRNAYRVGDTTATGQVLRESVGALDVLEAAAEAAGFERVRRTHEAHGAADPDARSASGIGIALGWHGGGFTGSGETRLASVATVELTDGGPHPCPRREHRDGPGLADGARPDRRGGAGREPRGRRCRAPGHIARPRQRTDRRVADDDGRGRAARDRRRPPPGRRGGAHGRPLRRIPGGIRAAARAPAGDRAVPWLPGDRVGRRHVPG